MDSQGLGEQSRPPTATSMAGLCLVATLMAAMVVWMLLSLWRRPLDRDANRLPETPQRAAAAGFAWPDMRIDVNRADAAELCVLPGPRLARQIITDRDANGLFRSLDDLNRVRGIGPRLIEGLRPFAVAQGVEQDHSDAAGADEQSLSPQSRAPQ
jgi:Helix-hairpin-helix motif